MIHSFFVHLLETGLILLLPGSLAMLLNAAITDQVPAPALWKAYGSVVGVTLFSAIVLVWS